MPEATIALKPTNAAKSITNCIDRVLIIHGGLTASLSDNQNGEAARWRLTVLPAGYISSQSKYSLPEAVFAFYLEKLCEISSSIRSPLKQRILSLASKKHV
jgi:hypothetical protein